MGLDMYLRAERYLPGFEFAEDDEKDRYRKVLEIVGLKGDASSPSATVEVTVAYWRKANAIHKWFVDNVQHGEDECRPHTVSRDQLQELQSLCDQLVSKYEEDPQRGKVLAEELLPPQSGFFFGSTDVDDWYWNDLRDTVKMIGEALENDCDWFTYQSSW